MLASPRARGARPPPRPRLASRPAAAPARGARGRGGRRELARQAPARGTRSPRARAVELVAARGECEAAQIAVRAPHGLARALRRGGAAPGRARRALPLPVSLYRVATLALARGSGPDGEPGEWPDPLVPARDAYVRRGAARLPGGGRAGAAAGDLGRGLRPGGRGGRRLRGRRPALRDGERALAEVPVRAPRLAVRAAAHRRLRRRVRAPHPRRHARARAARRPGDRARARGGGAPAPRHAVRALRRPARRRRAPRAAARSTGRATTPRSAPVLDGTLVPGVRGAFAEVRIAAPVWDGPEEDLAATLRAWRRHFEERGWADRLWLYTLDEPGPDAAPRAPPPRPARARGGDPRLRDGRPAPRARRARWTTSRRTSRSSPDGAAARGGA